MRTTVFTLLTAVAGNAYAEPIKIAVPDMKVSGAAESLGRILTEIMTTETSTIDNVSVVGSSDITAMLGFEQEKQLLGCADDVSCMAEIGGALGVDMLLVSDLGLVGDTHVINLKLIDTAEVKVLNRVYKTVPGKADALIEAMRRAIPDLLAPALSTKPVVEHTVTEPKPEPPPLSDEPPSEVEVNSGPSTWPMWTLMGVGGAALLAGTGLQVAAKLEYDKAWTSYRVNGSDLYSPNLWDRFDTASGLSTGGLVLLVTGGVMFAGGLTWLLLTPDTETSLEVTPVLGGDVTGITLTGGF